MLKLSRFVVASPVESGRVAVYSTLSKAFIILDADIWERLVNVSNDGGIEVSAEKASELELLGILVPDDIDELTVYRYWSQKLRYYFGRLIFTLLPTLDCNMSCVYCLQATQRKKKRPSTVCNVDEIVSFVRKYVDSFTPQELIICYFGGEPLFDFDSLAEIATSIKAALPSSTLLRQTVITNGVLLSDYAQSLRDLGLGTVQVTVDGPPAVHDRRRPLATGQGSFDAVICGMRSALNAGLFVNLQITLDRQNADTVSDLMEILKSEFGQGSALAVHICQVTRPNWECSHAAKFVGDAATMGRIRADAIEAALDSGLKIGDFLVNNPCPLECDYELIIAPDGSVYKCLSGIGEQDFRVGSVVDPPWLIHRSMARFVAWEPPLNGPCGKCTYLPECRGGCRFRAWVESGELGVDCLKDFFDQTMPRYLKAYSRTKEAGRLIRVLAESSPILSPRSATG